MTTARSAIKMLRRFIIFCADSFEPFEPFESFEPAEPAEPTEPAELLSNAIKGQHAHGANPEV